MVTGGTFLVLELNIQNALIAGNTVIANGYNTLNTVPEIGIGLTNNSNIRLCNNIAPAISWVSNEPNVTADHNIAQELVYWTENAQGVFAANPTWFVTPGFYGPAGLGAQSTTNTNEIVSAATFDALFVTLDVTAPPVLNLTLVPGPATKIASQTCLSQSQAIIAKL